MLIIFIIIVLFFSVVIHEVAHGSMAYYLGDNTAKVMGRLTLNPLKHIDLFGTIILPLLLVVAYSVSGTVGPVVGWAKPVPINPYNFRDKKWGSLKVALAGPSTNFLMALIFSLLIRFFNVSAALGNLFGLIALYNFAWAIFNLIPLPPLDGSWILFSFLPQRFGRFKNWLLHYGFYLLIFFCFFGLNAIFIGANALFYFISGKSF